MAFADIHNIEERLQQIDNRIIRIDFDKNKLRHSVIAWDNRDECEYIAFTVPHGQLDARVELEFYRIKNGSYNAFDEIRAWEAKKERSEERKIEDMALGMAENLLDSFRYKPSRFIS